jgi:serine/threonine protein kinase
MTYTHNKVLPESSRIGVYEINDVLKIGPFNITYRAWNHHVKEWVVLHEYFPCDFAIRGDDGLNVEPKLASEKENFEYGLQAFLKLGEILAQIEHPNIAVVENTLQFNGTVYLIVDYQEGMPRSELESFPTTFSEAKVRPILVSILNALQKIHDCKIVHGGIQPSAILLGKQGKPVLTDFAAARLAIASHIGKLDSELSAGYAPVEQYERTSELGPATDFYALGATMYHCITHNQPVAAQDRLMAISKNEPDPMVLRASSLSAAYSANLLETIDWMLHPNYNERPQSAAEILTALGSESASDPVESLAPGKKAINADSSPVVKDRAGIVVMTGIIALIGGGLWFGEKAAEHLNDTPSTVKGSPLSQQSTDQIVVKSVKNEKASVALVDAELGQEPEPQKISETPKIKIHEKSKKQLAKVDREKTLNLRADDNRSEFEKTQQMDMVDGSASLSRQQVSSKKVADNHSIKWFLAAAEQAMRDMRFTTPVGNSAYEYYQTVLVTDPSNAEALAGQRKIVDWYIRLIEEARAEGLPNTARVYLQRAEAVLPDEPKLHNIRVELNPKEKNH